jgi:hypothetical protein
VNVSSAASSSDPAAVYHELIPLDRGAEWEAALHDIPHAFGHTWGSCRAMQLSTGMATYLYRFRGGDTTIVCPVAERVFLGQTDVVTPYGFSGFVGNGTHPGFPVLWKEFARQQGWVCGYIGLNPILQRPTDYDAADVYEHTEVYVLDLSQQESELLENFSRNRRRELRDWARSGSRIVTDRKPLAEFVLREHAEFFRSRDASAVYQLSQETWLSLLELPNVLAFGATLGDSLAAVTLFAFTPTIGESLFNISIGDGVRLSTPLLWHGALSLRSLGVRFLNLGGGIRPRDGVARFKQRFGGRALPLRSLRQVYDLVVFERLCHEGKIDPQNRAGYFPAYRAR